MAKRAPVVKASGGVRQPVVDELTNQQILQQGKKDNSKRPTQIVIAGDLMKNAGDEEDRKTWKQLKDAARYAYEAGKEDDEVWDAVKRSFGGKVAIEDLDADEGAMSHDAGEEPKVGQELAVPDGGMAAGMLRTLRDTVGEVMEATLIDKVIQDDSAYSDDETSLKAKAVRKLVDEADDYDSDDDDNLKAKAVRKLVDEAEDYDSDDEENLKAKAVCKMIKTDSGDLKELETMKMAVSKLVDEAEDYDSDDEENLKAKAVKKLAENADHKLKEMAVSKLVDEPEDYYIDDDNLKEKAVKDLVKNAGHNGLKEMAVSELVEAVDNGVTDDDKMMATLRGQAIDGLVAKARDNGLWKDAIQALISGSGTAIRPGQLRLEAIGQVINSTKGIEEMAIRDLMKMDDLQKKAIEKLAENADHNGLKEMAVSKLVEVMKEEKDKKEGPEAKKARKE